MQADGPPPSGGPLASGTDTAGESRDALPPRRLRLDLSYDGSGFRGFAENRDVDTVGGRLRGALEQVLRHPVTLTCAGRTDAGVHARGQVVTVDTSAAVDPIRLRDSLNAMIGPQVVVSEIRTVDATFDARFSARSRAYRYSVLNREVPDPFLAGTAWWVPSPLDVGAMNAAAADLVGEHDFSSFCRRPRVDPGAEDVSLVRRVLTAHWVESADQPGLLEFRVSASAFCHQMVRSIVGLLVDVGRGHRAPDDVAEALTARDRSRAGQLAPPHGLVLWEVGY